MLQLCNKHILFWAVYDFYTGQSQKHWIIAERKTQFVHIVLKNKMGGGGGLIHCSLIHSYETYEVRPEFCWATSWRTPIVVKFLNLIYSRLTFHYVLELEFISLEIRCDRPLRESGKYILFCVC